MPHFYRLTSLIAASVLGLLAAACSASAVDPAQYRAYLADPAHGLTHTREVNGAVLTCTYRPTELLVLQEVGSSGSTPATRDSMARAYAGKTYCALTLARNGGEIENQFVTNPPAYQQALSYLSTGLAATATLASATTPDSVSALTSMHLRDFGMTGHSTVLFVFDTRQLATDGGFTVTFRDRYFGLGTQRFAFAARDLAAVPTLCFE